MKHPKNHFAGEFCDFCDEYCTWNFYTKDNHFEAKKKTKTKTKTKTNKKPEKKKNRNIFIISKWRPNNRFLASVISI